MLTMVERAISAESYSLYALSPTLRGFEKLSWMPCSASTFPSSRGFGLKSEVSLKQSSTYGLKSLMLTVAKTAISPGSYSLYTLSPTLLMILNGPSLLPYLFFRMCNHTRSPGLNSIFFLCLFALVL